MEEHRRKVILGVLMVVMLATILGVLTGLLVTMEMRPGQDEEEGSQYRTGSEEYYMGIDTSQSPDAFQEQLHQLIRLHRSLSYAELWTAFQVTDVWNEEVQQDGELGEPGAWCSNSSTTTNAHNQSHLHDIYSTYCWLSPSQQCGNYKKEGDCFNREHAWPKSWWGGGQLASYTDLFHLFPTDGYVNGRRADFPLGHVDRSKPLRYVSSNGSTLGSCLPLANITFSSSTFVSTNQTALTAVPDVCWEPADWYKGLFARMYFYMETRYRNEFTCCDTEGTLNWQIKPWMRTILRAWHHQFPPSQFELRRNYLIFTHFQGNRNPFIDFPHWVDLLF